MGGTPKVNIGKKDQSLLPIFFRKCPDTCNACAKPPPIKRVFVDLKGEFKVMAKRIRTNRKEVSFSNEELFILRKKMELAHTTNFSSYSRRMSLDGLIIHKNFSDLKELIKQLSKIGNNINQIAKKLNGTGNFSGDDMKIMNQNYIQMTKEINSVLLQMIYEDRKSN